MRGRSPLRERGESLPRRERLLRRADFLNCYRNGRRHHGSLVVLYIARSRESGCRDNGCRETGRQEIEPPGSEGVQRRHPPRLGITVSRKVGGSVDRHRIKRRIKEIYRRWPERERLPTVDLVVHVKPPAGTADFEALRAELDRLFRLALRRRSPGRARAR